jgi:hypothetical protein
MWTQFGYLTFKLLSFERSEAYQHFADPVDRPNMHDLASLRHSLAVVGETLLSLAHGNGKFEPIQIGWLKKQFGGRVLAANVGQSLAPTFPLKGAFLASRPFFGWEYSWPGFYDHPIIQTDVYGRYELVNCASDFWVDHYIWAKGYSPVAAWHDPQGRIAWLKDEGDEGQRLYKSVNLNWFDAKVENITLVVFPSLAHRLPGIDQPQTMKDYTGVKLIDRDGLAAFRKQCIFEASCIFEWFRRTRQLLSTRHWNRVTPENELAKVIRGFMLASPAAVRSRATPAVKSTGRATSPYVPRCCWASPSNWHARMTCSTASGSALQNGAYGRRSVNEYHRKSETLLAESAQPGLPHHDAHAQGARSRHLCHARPPRFARRSVVEAIRGHPLVPCALLVPFVYFLEKLLFCFNDIRKQLAAQGAIFPHGFRAAAPAAPAFEMVRSSLMIMLGYYHRADLGWDDRAVFGQVQENLEDLRKRRGMVDAPRRGQPARRAGSAFMLGLNNMHRAGCVPG